MVVGSSEPNVHAKFHPCQSSICGTRVEAEQEEEEDDDDDDDEDDDLKIELFKEPSRQYCISHFQPHTYFGHSSENVGYVFAKFDPC